MDSKCGYGNMNMLLFENKFYSEYNLESFAEKGDLYCGVSAFLGFRKCPSIMSYMLN